MNGASRVGPIPTKTLIPPRFGPRSDVAEASKALAIPEGFGSGWRRRRICQLRIAQESGGIEKNKAAKRSHALPLLTCHHRARIGHRAGDNSNSEMLPLS